MSVLGHHGVVISQQQGNLIQGTGLSEGPAYLTGEAASRASAHRHLEVREIVRPSLQVGQGIST